MALFPLLFSLTIAYFIALASPAVAVPAQYSITTYGAKPDGKTDSTKAILDAWNQACHSSSPSTIYVPTGRFSIKNLVFRGPCKSKSIMFLIDGTLIAPSDYYVIGTIGNWIMFHVVDGVTISGGTLDGQGTGLWSCKSKSKSTKSCPQGATNLEFSNSKNIRINGLASVNSQLFHIVINSCQNVKVQGVRVSAAGNSPNTDGIHVQSSTGVTIMNSRIGTGDDCISIGPGTNNLWIENISCGPGHGISIGSLGKEFHEAGVQNVTVKTVTFTGTENGVRIKSWGASGVKVSDVTYQDIHGSSQTEVAVKFICSGSNPCTGLRLEDVKLTYKNKAADSSCKNADGVASGIVQPSSCL
ncbi:unnamed protein product [Linum perenne]